MSLKQIKGCRIRVTDLDETGAPEVGVDASYVSEALVTWGHTLTITEGESVEVPNACGTPLTIEGDDLPSGMDISLQVNTPDPRLTEKLAGGTVFEDSDGYAYPRLNQLAKPNGVSVEIWAKRYLANGQLDTENPWNWWVFPMVRLNINDATFENGPYLPTFEGRALENEAWLDGPTNDWPETSTSVAQFVKTATIPDASDDYVSVVAS